MVSIDPGAASDTGVYSVYFGAAICYWTVTCVVLVCIPTARTASHHAATAYFALLCAALGLTTFMAMGGYGSGDWRFLDLGAQCLVGLQLLLWNLTGPAEAFAWTKWMLLPLGLSVFYPILVYYAGPVIHAAFVALISGVLATTLFYREMHGRRRKTLLYLGVALAAVNGVASVVFLRGSGQLSDRVCDLGTAWLRLFQTFLLLFWFNFWIQTDATHRESWVVHHCCRIVCKSVLPTAAAPRIAEETSVASEQVAEAVAANAV